MDTYYVWRREDGYVSSTCYNPSPDRDFDVLLITDDWNEARVRIESERDDSHFATVAGWV